MKQSLRVIGTAMLIASSMLLFATPSAHAASQGFNIITSPLPIKLTTQPGQTVETELRMKNQGTEPETIRVGLMKFGATGENGAPSLADLSNQDAFGSWVRFTPQQFVAEPGVWKNVKMTIRVPPEAGLGYYMAVTFSRASQPGVPKATSFKGSVATLVLLNVKSANEKRELKLVDLTSSKRMYEYLPATFNVRLRNSGNIYIAPAGNVFIQRGNKTIETLNFNEAGGSVLPNSNRIIKVQWTNGFPVYKDKIVDGKPVLGERAIPKQDLKWDFTQLNKFRVGRYTAKVLVVYDNGKQDVPIEASVGFWVFPWKIVLISGIILTLIGLGTFTLVRSFIRKIRNGKVASKRA